MMKTNNGNTLVYILIITLLAAILMVVANPDQEKHLDAVKNEMSGKNALSGALARTILAVDPPLYHSAVLFSYTKRDDKLYTIGILGYVWVNTEDNK